MSELDTPALDAPGAGARLGEDQLRKARQLARLGRFIDLQPWLPALEAAPSVPAQLLAARVRGHLGARRLCDARALRLWRRHRGDGEAMAEMVRSTAYRLGPYRGWQLLRAMAFPSDAPPVIEADWHSLRAYVLGSLRLFDAAEAAFDVARALAPQEAWILVEWAYICEQRDRYDEGIAHCEQALEISPGGRAATQSLAHLYTLVGRDDDALSLLQDAAGRMQSGGIAVQLFELQMERGDHAAADAALSLVERYSPLAEKPLKQWLSMRRADVALALGRHDEACAHARAGGGPFYDALAQRLEVGGATPRRVELPVGFVRQHFNTCAPATLATLSRYWGRDASHPEIAEQICYDGTPNHSERRWAEDQGFHAQEFTVDWPTAVALVDAGVPFTLTTVHTASAHLQAVIGYDALRGTLLIRDPYKRSFNEFDAKALFESHAANGPRGMLLVPLEMRERIAHIPLPDAPLWDGYHRVMHALSRHQRDTAAQAVQAMQAQQPGHRLVLMGQRALACYDGDRHTELTITEQLLGRYPDDVNLRLAKAWLLSLLGSREQQAQWWAAMEAERCADPVVLTRHADFLSDDGREQATVLRQYRRALRFNPTHAAAWGGLAGVHWQRGERDLARPMSRIAACLSDTHEGLAETHFRTCRFMGDAEAGVAFLRERVARAGAKSAAPAMTLFNQLEALERTGEAFALLDDAVTRRPDDGDLLLFSADALMRYGRIDEADAMLARAEGCANRVAWLRHKARWLRSRQGPAAALPLAREACALEPLDVGLHQLVASLLAQCEGRSAALAHLRAAAAAQPHHLDLQQAFVGWLGSEECDEAIEVLQRLLQANPTHAWAQRELAGKLVLRQRFDEAMVHAELARGIAPHQSATHTTLAYVRLRQGHVESARAHLQDALRLSVDNDYAIDTLLEIEHTLAGRREALQFVRGELKRQAGLGDGLLTFQRWAATTLEPEELRADLDDMLASRPDLWQAWTAKAIQLTREGEFAAAVALLDRAMERFALLPRLHLEKARAQMLMGDREAARGTLHAALQINPSWTQAVRLYVETVLDEGQGHERALAVLDAALHRSPEDTELRAWRASVHRAMGRRDAALADLREALQHDPALRWAWDMFNDLSRAAGQPAAARELAQRVAEQHPGMVQAWLRVADHAADTDAALAATDRALALEPRDEAAFAARLAVLHEAKRFAELQAALAAAPWPDGLPLAVAVYEARLAWAQGRHQAAIDHMRGLLERDANSYALWRELADWYDERNQDAQYVEAAQHMVRLAPNHSVARGYLGHAYQKTSQFDAARRHLARALELDPTYQFAGLRLADLQLDAQLLDDAAATLAVLQPHHPGPYLALRGVRLAVLRKDEGAAASPLREIIGRRWGDVALCEEALKLVHEAGWEALLLRTVRQAFSEGECARPATAYWLARQGQGRWRLPGAFYRDVKAALRQDPKHSLKSDLLQRLGRLKDRSLLNRFVADFRDALRQDLECWGMVGYAYLEQSRAADVARWMSDWRERADAPAWALDNLSLALRRLGRDAQARPVTARSLEVDPGNLDAQTWQAVDAAVDGRHDEVKAALARIDGASLRPYYQQLLTMLGAYMDAVDAGDGRKALARFASLRNAGDDNRALRRALDALGARLVRQQTPAWARPWRRLQFAFGWC